MRLVVVSLGLLALAASGARADQAPVRRAGEWQTLMTSSLVDGPAQQTKACYREESADEIFRHMPGCGKVEPVTSGSRTSFDAVCQRGTTVVTMHGEIAATGGDTFHSQVHATYVPPVGTLSEMTVTGDSHWVGPCPAGEKPAD